MSMRCSASWRSTLRVAGVSLTKARLLPAAEISRRMRSVWPVGLDFGGSRRGSMGESGGVEGAFDDALGVGAAKHFGTAR